MRLGYVQMVNRYLVDLDNKEMVEHAKNAILEDVTNAVFKQGEKELLSWIEETPAVPEDNLTEADIPEFLKDTDEDDTQEEWTCPHCKQKFPVDASTLPMNGIINCPLCGKEIREE